MMNILEAIELRRSIRKFSPAPLTQEQISQVLAAARLAPSSKNRQPWRFVVCLGASKASLCQAMEQGLAREASQPLLPNSAQYLQTAANTLRIMGEAPVLICVQNSLGQPLTQALTPEDRIGEICNIQSLGAALENMALAATGLGLGSLWVCDSFFAQAELEAELGMAQGYLAAVMALGVPAEQPPARPRLPINEIAEWRY